jgi:hypothetical protein
MVLESFAGAGRIIGALLSRSLRARRTTWGATTDEATQTFPGDDLVPSPAWSYTHAVTVAAQPAQVWPWLAQIGQGRGGFYSYQGLENLVGCRIRNTSVVLDEFTRIEVGDEVKLHPRAPGLRVVVAQPPRSLVLFGGAEGSPDTSVWGFHLVDAGDGHTRLIERGHHAHGPGFGSRLMSGPTVLEPISFVMSRKMLLRIAELAGSSAPDLPEYHPAVTVTRPYFRAQPGAAPANSRSKPTCIRFSG